MNCQCHFGRKGWELDLGWVPWDQKEEADALTNGAFTACGPSKRFQVDLEGIEREVTLQTWNAADNPYQEVQTARAAGAASGQVDWQAPKTNNKRISLHSSVFADPP